MAATEGRVRMASHDLADKGELQYATPVGRVVRVSGTLVALRDCRPILK